MPSEKVLSQKQKYVADLAEELKNATSGVIIDYKGINVAEDTEFRRAFREAGVKYTVVKNTMLRLAAKEAGLEGLCDVLEGTTALAIGDDAIAPAKVVSKYADKLKKKVKIKIGFMDGEILEAAKVAELGKLPSKEQLVGQLVSVLVAPIRGMAVALNAIAEKESA